MVWCALVEHPSRCASRGCGVADGAGPAGRLRRVSQEQLALRVCVWEGGDAWRVGRSVSRTAPAGAAAPLQARLGATRRRKKAGAVRRAASALGANAAGGADGE